MHTSTNFVLNQVRLHQFGIQQRAEELGSGCQVYSGTLVSPAGTGRVILTTQL
jgi:hypothetical protein